MKKKNIEKSLQYNKGFTLVEVLLTLLILSFVLFPIYEFLRLGALSWEFGENRTEAVQNTRIGLDKMCDEIKHARELYTVNQTQIRFWWKDLNDDDIADPDEILSYSWSGISGDSLMRQFDSETSSSPLALNIDNFELVYYDQTGAQTSDPNLVTFLKATLKTRITKRNNDYTSVMTKSVTPRNL